MPRALPGMPLAAGDVFVCRIPDGGTPPPAPRPAIAPAPRPRGWVWLVLAICPHCNPATGRYCHDHDARNWWLETMSKPRR